MTVEEIDSILRPGVKGLLDKTRATNLVLTLILYALDTRDSDSLRYLSRFFTPSDYEDLVEERALISKCGYPTCSRELLDMRGKPRKPPANPLDPWKKYWCSPHCFQASMFYQKQLSNESLVTRKDVAWLPYGQMNYENGMLLLDEMLVIAKLEGKPVSEVVAQTLRRQVELNRGLSSLSIDEVPKEDTGDAADSITKLAITER